MVPQHAHVLAASILLGLSRKQSFKRASRYDDAAANAYARDLSPSNSLIHAAARDTEQFRRRLNRHGGALRFLWPLHEFHAERLLDRTQCVNFSRGGIY